MLFTSAVFLLFFAVFYACYLLLRGHRTGQNVLLLVANYVFYGWWDWRFLSLLLLTTWIDFAAGRWMGRVSGGIPRRWILVGALAFNLGMLGFFKYFNFFTDSAVELCSALGFHADAPTIRILLPLGISFYTFQAVSYVVDVYRLKTKPTGSLLDFSIYVAFFPLLISGPIERSDHLLPQIAAPRRITLEQLNAGVFLILWGFFKKLVIADNIGPIADEVFDGYLQQGGLNVILGALAFAFQIYCDFSGYSDIARGLAKLMGFDLILNFKLPYFALSPSDFWRRWHISLSTWLRDYLYIPLGGNRGTKLQTFRNLMVTMLLGGLWHGAAWNFVLWGALPWRHFGHLSGCGARRRIGQSMANAILGARCSAPNAADVRPHPDRVVPFPGGVVSSNRIHVVPCRPGNQHFHLVVCRQTRLLRRSTHCSFKSSNMCITTSLRHCDSPWCCRSRSMRFSLLMMLMFGNVGANEFIYFQF